MRSYKVFQKCSVTLQFICVCIAMLAWSKLCIASGPSWLPEHCELAVYPVAAREKEIEGYCIVVFKIDEFGQVRNSRTTDCLPSGVFEASSIQAIQRFRWQPFIRDGVAIPIENLRWQFNFSAPIRSSHSQPYPGFRDRADFEAKMKKIGESTDLMPDCVPSES